MTTPDNGPRFRGDYPADWPAISEAAMATTGFRCLRCGHPRGDGMVRGILGPAKRLSPCTPFCTHAQDLKLRTLTVHHLDGQKDNSRWWNLLPLCQVDHLIVQAKVIPERAWLWEHTDWFKPYAAGFYAWYYGRVETTRADVEARLDYYLALGQPWLYPTVTPAPVPSPSAAGPHGGR
jgi:5-methylcytosine-specific restriction endonuclease McrA